MAPQCSPLWPLTPRTARIEMPGAQDVLPIGENAQEACRRVAEFDEAAGFCGWQPRFKEWGRAANLRKERLRAYPLSPGRAGRFDQRGGQTTL